MTALLGIVISVILSAALTVVMRSRDRNDNSMEKVKRYADKRLGEFDEYFRKQQEHLSVSGNELESKDIEAKAAVKRLEQQIADLETNAAALQAKIDEVTSIGDRINTYDSTIGHLLDMTRAVEENLQRVQDEADVIDKYNTRLEKQDKTIGAIERRVGEVTRRFTEKNLEQLKEIGSGLLEKYEERARAIDESTQKYLGANQEILDKINADIAAAYANAAEAAENLESDAFDSLKARSEERRQEIISSLEDNVRKLSDYIDSKVQGVQKDLIEKTRAFFN